MREIVDDLNCPRCGQMAVQVVATRQSISSSRWKTTVQFDCGAVWSLQGEEVGVCLPLNGPILHCSDLKGYTSIQSRELPQDNSRQDDYSSGD
jgi:hypothetical protein